MGHLINATSMRLGWFKHWWDIWTVKQIYYTSLLYSCFRIRYFLIYLFFSKTFMIKYVMFFGHFHIEKVYKFLLIKLYYYDALLEQGIDDNFDEIVSYFKEYKRSFKYNWKYTHRRKYSYPIPRRFLTEKDREDYAAFVGAKNHGLFSFSQKGI